MQEIRLAVRLPCAVGPRFESFVLVWLCSRSEACVVVVHAAGLRFACAVAARFGDGVVRRVFVTGPRPGTQEPGTGTRTTITTAIAAAATAAAAAGAATTNSDGGGDDRRNTKGTRKGERTLSGTRNPHGETWKQSRNLESRTFSNRETRDRNPEPGPVPLSARKTISGDLIGPVYLQKRIKSPSGFQIRR